MALILAEKQLSMKYISGHPETSSRTGPSDGEARNNFDIQLTRGNVTVQANTVSETDCDPKGSVQRARQKYSIGSGRWPCQ